MYSLKLQEDGPPAQVKAIELRTFRNVLLKPR